MDENRANRRCGTLGYMAPEILRGEIIKNINLLPNCDIFSLGVTFHKFIVGRLPFPKNNSKQLLHCNKNCFINLDDKLWSKIPADLYNIVKVMLEADVYKRWTAIEIIHTPYLLAVNKNGLDFQKRKMDANIIPTSFLKKLLSQNGTDNGNVNDSDQESKDCDSPKVIFFIY